MVSWTAMNDLSTDDIVTEADMDALRSNLEYIWEFTEHSCRVVRTNALNLATGAWTDVTFPAETFDTDNMHSTSSNTERITVPKAGLYLLQGGANWASSAAGFRYLRFGLNGSAGYSGTVGPLKSTSNEALSISDLLSLNANDYVTLQAMQDSGGDLSISNCFFMATAFENKP
jgi:hypothetical protein